MAAKRALGLKVREKDWPEYFGNPWCCSGFVSHCTEKWMPVALDEEDLGDSPVPELGQEQGSSCCFEAACIRCVEVSSKAPLNDLVAKAHASAGAWTRFMIRWGVSKIQGDCVLVLDQKKLGDASANKVLLESGLRGFLFVERPSIATVKAYVAKHRAVVTHADLGCVALLGWDEHGWIIDSYSGALSQLSFEYILPMMLVPLF